MFDMKKMAQVYAGANEAEVQQFFFPTATTAELASSVSGINLHNKFAGKRCYETTLDLDYIANGPAATDTWTLNDGLGLTVVTPS